MKKSILFMITVLFVMPVLAGPFLEKVGGSSMIFRGRAPKISEVDKIKAKGINKVLIFKVQSTDEVDKQRAWMVAAGFQDNDIVHIEFPWKGITKPRKACEQIIQALRVLKSVSDSNQDRILFHCTVGEDRTGLLAGLWTQLKDSEDMLSAYQNQMCQKGYSGGNKAKPIKVQEDVDKNLTPLFEYLSSQIAAGELTLEQIDESVCRRLPVSAQWGLEMSSLTKCSDLK